MDTRLWRVCRTSWIAPLLISSTLLLPRSLRAEECGLLPLPPDMIAAAPTTTFLPSGNIGQVLVKWKQPETVRIFEIDGLKPATAKIVSEPSVMSVKPAPDATYEGFAGADSSVVSMIVPERKDTLWHWRVFVVRVCGAGTDRTASGWALVRVPVISATTARLISVAVVFLLYAAFALAMCRVRARPHPLAAKWPAYATPRELEWYEYFDPVVLTAGPFNRGSIQKLQVLFFTFLVSGMVLSLVLTLGVLTNLSATVAMLLGISAVGAAIGQKTTTSNERLKFENWAWLVRKGVLPIHQNESPRWSDLVMTGREFDVYKLQTLIFSVVVAVALLTAGADRLGNFTIPDTLLGLLGLSQVVYVAGTLVRPPSVSDLDKALTELRTLESKEWTAVARNCDVDADGNLPTPLPPVPAVLPPLKQRIKTAGRARKMYETKARETEIMLESTLEVPVDGTKLAPDVA